MAVLHLLGVNAGLVVLGVLAVTPLVVAVDEGLSRIARRVRHRAETETEAEETAAEWTAQPAARLS